MDTGGDDGTCHNIGQPPEIPGVGLKPPYCRYFPDKGRNTAEHDDDDAGGYPCTNSTDQPFRALSVSLVANPDLPNYTPPGTQCNFYKTLNCGLPAYDSAFPNKQYVYGFQVTDGVCADLAKMAFPLSDFDDDDPTILSFGCTPPQ